MPKKSELLKKLCEELDFVIDFPDMKVLSELEQHISGLEDTRKQGYVEHKLTDIVMITLLAVLSNSDEWSKIEIFARKKEAWLKQFLELPSGIPSHDTIQRVMSLIDPDTLHNACIGFLILKMDELQQIAQSINIQDAKESPDIEIISIDGKTSTGSSRNKTIKDEIKALQTVSAYSSKYEINLAQKYIDDKTNEIPITPQIINMLNVKGSIVTWDALNTQKETVKTVIQGKGDYVAALKGNHKLLYEDVRDYFDEDKKRDLKIQENTYKRTIEKAHSNIETREYYMDDTIKWLPDRSQWAGLKSIGLEEKTIEKPNGDKVYQQRYFLISFTNNVKDFSHATREHWQIENKLHWHLDFTFKEDANTTMEKNSLKSLGVIKRIALSILKLVQQVYNMSLSKIRYSLSLDFENEISKIFSLIDTNQIKNMMK